MIARHGAAVLRVATQFSLCHDDALDAYQRAFEIYLRRLDSVDPATEGAWLRVVVKHEAMAIRRARLESVDRDEVDLDLTIAAAREVEDEVAGGERVHRSVEALRALKPDEARALLLKAEGHSYQEIGSHFGWTYTKVNRSIAEGRRRFLKVFNGIEAGEVCERHEGTLRALAAGTATTAEVLSLRPHLRHCTACRAAVRDMRRSRSRRIALWLPFGWLARLELGMQYAASGGGRLGPAAALVGLCLGGVGAGAACMVTGALPAPPIISHAGRSEPASPRPAKPVAVKRRPRPTATPAAAPRAQRGATAAATATPAATRTPRPARAKPKAKVARKRHTAPVTQAVSKPKAREFGFEGAAPAATPPPQRSAPIASAAGTGGGGGSSAPAEPRPAPKRAGGTEFGFEG